MAISEKSVMEKVDLTAREKTLLATAVGMALASRKRALNAPITSDEMKSVIQREMSEYQAIGLRLL